MTNMLKDCSKSMGEEALHQLAEEFRHSVDPFGNPWKPIVWRKGQPLVNNGILRNSWGLTNVKPEGFDLYTNVGYAGVHQNGADFTMPPQVNAHVGRGRNKGQFARKGGSRAKAQRVSFSRAHRIRIPRRQMVPVNAEKSKWDAPLAREANACLAEWIKSFSQGVIPGAP